MNVQLPDNSVVQFPDGMPNDQVNAAITSYLGQSAPPLQSDAQPSTNLDRIGYGMQQPVEGLGQAMLHGAQYLPQSVLDDVPGLQGSDKTMDIDLAQKEAQYQAQRTAAGSTGIDWDKMLGGMITTAPLTAAIPAASGGLLAKAGLGAVEGAGIGATQPTTGGSDDYAGQKLAQAAGGSVTGGVLGGGLGAATAALSPNISPEVKALMAEGITPTMGQILGGGYKTTEDKLTSIPMLGDIIKTGQGRALDQFNSAALGRALAPIGEDAPTAIGRQGLNQVSDKLSAAYDDVMPNLSLKLDQPFAVDIEDARNTLPSGQQPAFDEIMEKQFQKFSPTGELSGEPLKGFQSEISQQARGYGSDASFDNRQLGSALDDVHAALGDALQRSNPASADRLSNINEGYANYATLRKAASQVKEDGPFTPAQLAQAIRGNDQSVGKGAFAKGSALMQDLSDPGVSVLGNKYPESGTAGRAMMEMGGAALLGHSVIPVPAMLGVGAASLPYLNPTTQKLAAALLTKRPAFLQSLRSGGDAASPYLTAGAASDSGKQ